MKCHIFKTVNRLADHVALKHGEVPRERKPKVDSLDARNEFLERKAKGED